MHGQSTVQSRDEFIQRNGEWTAHDIDLGHGVSTMDRNLQQEWRVQWNDHLIRRFGGTRVWRLAYVIATKLNAARFVKPLWYFRRRILDLACLEGLFTIEFARAGAHTVGLEIRDIHLAKANFAKDVLKLERAQFVRGDVRSIPDDLGTFDTIICAGIFYHLDFPDCVRFLCGAAKRTSDLFILDSHLAYPHIHSSVLPLSEMRDYAFEGRTFRGREIVEHHSDVSAEEKANVHLWASIDNDLSVWLLEEDVVRVMADEGLVLVHRAYPNAEYEQNNPDRPTLVFKRA